MKYTFYPRLFAALAITLSLSGCATMTIFSYMDKGFYADHGRGEGGSIHGADDACSVHGNCDGVQACELYGNC